MIILISCIPLGATKSKINRLQNCMADKLARFACSLDAPIFWVDETIYLIIFRVNGTLKLSIMLIKYLIF